MRLDRMGRSYDSVGFFKPAVPVVATALAALALAGCATPPRSAASGVAAPEDAALAHARKLLRSTILIDGHNDLPYAIRGYKQAPSDIVAYDLRKPTPGDTDIARLRAGGLGAPILLYLAAAGVGTIGIVDDDEVSLSNLQRQVIHATPDIGRPKVESARDTIAALNPHVAVELHRERFTPDNARRLIEAYDVIVDGSDNFATRFLAADVAFAVGRILVMAAVSRFDGSLTVQIGRAHV